MSTALAAARAKTKGKRMLREALDAYGDEGGKTLSEWNASKQQAERDGTWRWKASDPSAMLLAVKNRVVKDASEDVLGQKFATDLDAVMAAELHPVGAAADWMLPNSENDQCAWRERIGGKLYYCMNELPHNKKKPHANPTEPLLTPKRQCKWHARECMNSDHPMDTSRVIEIPNETGYCLVCFEATALHDRGTLQKTPPRLPPIKIPGVCEVSLKREVQREMLARNHKKEVDLSTKLTAASRCVWEKEHSESAFLWQCCNRVVMHPTLRNAFLPFCGYHASRCIHEYGASRKQNAAPCPAIDRRNPFGMCRNHLEAHLSALSFEARATCVFAESEFEVPGLVECRKDQLEPKLKPHPLAPKTPPPLQTVDASEVDRFVIVKSHPTNVSRMDRAYQRVQRIHQYVFSAIVQAIQSTLVALLQHPNPASKWLQDTMWQLQFVRRGALVATRIQRMFRGNRARRRVRAMGWERAAIQRIHSCLEIQRIARGYLGRRAFADEAHAVQVAVPTIQRIVRGGLARLHCRRRRAIICIQQSYRAFRQRCLASAMREEIAYMRGLQRQANANYDEMLVQLDAFKRLRARRVLRAHVASWRRRKEAHAQVALERLQSLLSTVKIQRAFRRHQRYTRLQRQYLSALKIQTRVRGWLTRHMWKDDPGLRWISNYTSSRTGLAYGKIVVLSQPSRSYAFPSRKLRMQFGAQAIQRVYSGFLGRVAANMQWIAMLKRWEWLSLSMDTGSETPSDSMTLGHERYGFLLPSSKYHHERRRHMIKIQRTIKAERGFAYKYQNILELIQDRDGKRAWSLGREEKWKREQEAAAKHMTLQATTKSPSKRRHHLEPECVGEKSVAMATALFPVGCLVAVASMNRRDPQRFHKARVTAVHPDASKETNAASADVEYLTSVVSLRGVHVYHETRVPLARLRLLGPMEEKASPLNQRRRRRSVGKLIERALGRLKVNLQVNGAKWDTRDDLKKYNREDEAVLESVDALADRLRNDEPQLDLLADHRQFVNFVFLNSTLLNTKWLQVVDHVRYGTRDRERPQGIKATSVPPLSPSQVAFYQAFGFDSVMGMKRLVPMPTRANDIENRMTRLGFLHEPRANVKDNGEETPPCRLPKRLRPQSTPTLTRDPAKDREVVQRAIKDDAILHPLPIPTTPDLYQRLYDLKTLPRERQRERILEVVDRDARSFVCGYPACGRCFSTHDAARLHQEAVHLHQRRLASATPLTDQYLHAYWPPTSPWTQEAHRSFTPSVGYYHCRFAECKETKEGQFRTRRELQRHLHQVHKVVRPTSLMDDEASPTASPRVSQASTSAPAPSPPSVSALLWLGPYAMCHTKLEQRIEGFPRTAAWHGEDAVVCVTHGLVPSDPERCRACFLRIRRLALPCRIYRTVALPGTQQQEQRQEGDEQSSISTTTLEGYVIFSVDDPLMCPVVREQDLIPLDELDSDRQKRVGRQAARRRAKYSDNGRYESPLVLLRILLLCRDANSVAWAIGHVFRPYAPDNRQQTQPSQSDSELEPDAYRVTLDKSHIFGVALADCRAIGMVHQCSPSVFIQKYFGKDDPVALRQLREVRKTTHHDTTTEHRLTATLARFWMNNDDRG